LVKNIECEVTVIEMVKKYVEIKRTQEEEKKKVRRVSLMYRRRVEGIKQRVATISKFYFFI
jgi:hypothetical protein